MKIYSITREVINGAKNIQHSAPFMTVVVNSLAEETKMFNNCHLFIKSDNLKYILAGSDYRVRLRVKELVIVNVDDFAKACDNHINDNIDKANSKIRQLNRALAITNKRLCRQNQDKLQEVDKFDYKFVDKYELEINEDTLDVIVY